MIEQISFLSTIVKDLLGTINELKEVVKDHQTHIGDLEARIAHLESALGIDKEES